eukprot:scaffold4935_cov67-Phaeocystis_antarctica.AAC.4
MYNRLCSGVAHRGRLLKLDLDATAGGGVAHRGRLLKLDLDATAGGGFDGLLGLVVEMVVLQAATGRPQGSDVGAGARATRPPKGRRGLGAHAAHEEGSIA